MSNGKVTAIIVPQTGRIASFAKNNGDNVFWENQSLSGHLPEVPAAEWQNFGGDKSWPAPQSSWPEITKRAWPPPTAFDQMAVKIEADETGVTTTSQVDTDFGIRVLRHIALKPNEPTMEVTTTYEKVQGTPVEASIWTITQLKDPESVRVLLAQNSSTMPDGFITQMGTKMPSLKQSGNLLTFDRDQAAPHKIGTESDSLFWFGKKGSVLKISSARVVGEYPDQGSSSEVYTNPDPLPYVELEMLGPLRKLSAGESTEKTVTYKFLQLPKRSLFGGAAANSVIA